MQSDKNIFITLSFYDFAGYILPGALVSAFIYWLFVGIFAVKYQLEVETIWEFLLILVICYVVGHLIQPLANLIETRHVKRWGGWFSEQFLREDNDYYTPEFKDNIKAFALQIFSLQTDMPSDAEAVRKKRRQEIFNLCYSLIVQEKVGHNTELFNSIYGLYRGLITSIWIGIVINIVIILKFVLLQALIMSHISLCQNTFCYYDKLYFELGIISLIFLVIFNKLLEVRFEKFGQRFADSAYRNFYVWFKRNNNCG